MDEEAAMHSRSEVNSQGINHDSSAAARMIDADFESRLNRMES